VRSDPIPQNRAGLPLDTDRSVVAPDSDRHDGLGRMYLFEVKTRMPRIISEKEISGDRLLAHIAR
jgi:hypothetical protein